MQYKHRRNATTPLVLSYRDQLETLSKLYGVDLKQACLTAGVPDSTYYRMQNGTDPRLPTACKIALAVERIARAAEAPHDGALP